MLVDTHAHICAECFDPDREEVLERARAAGVAAVVAVGEDIGDAPPLDAHATEVLGEWLGVGEDEAEGILAGPATRRGDAEIL